VGSQEISGLAVFNLAWKGGRLVAVREIDHTLRRFGQVDVIRLDPEKRHVNYRVGGADEIWVVIEGQVKMVATDLRDQSPSNGVTQDLSLVGESPEAVLIPFGTQVKISSVNHAVMMRITSHADELFPDDMIFMEED
jgi:dTDP-4-dehydrorhamnose 3,5-epimerase-like enzyme